MKFAPLLLVLSVFASMVAPHISAQVVDISTCREIQDRLARFDCYENLDEAQVVRQSQPDEVPAAVVTSPKPTPVETRGSRPPAAVPAEQEVAGFGREETRTAAVVSGDNNEKQLRDTIAALEQMGPNIWTITLSSGQVWRQMEGKPYRLEVGDSVRIYQSFWGKSYRLTAPRLASFIQVQRIE
jgi:hypothetical protein